MAEDYIEFAALAKELVENYGRSVTFVKLQRTVADANKPWRGPADGRGTPADTATGLVAFVSPDSARELGFLQENENLIPGVTQIGIAAATSFVGKNLEEFDFLDDGGNETKMERVDILKPGAVRLLYFIQCKGVGA